MKHFNKWRNSALPWGQEARWVQSSLVVFGSLCGSVSTAPSPRFCCQSVFYCEPQSHFSASTLLRGYTGNAGWLAFLVLCWLAQSSSTSLAGNYTVHLSPDEIIFWQLGLLKINATLVWTWFLMLFLVTSSKLITRKLGTSQTRSRWQDLLEIIVVEINKQIRNIGLHQPEKYIGFLGTVFLFVAISSLFTVIPGYESPTASLSTTVALALCVLVAVPLFGIKDQGMANYLKTYIKPTVVMLPFNLISELSRTLALAVRLFGNMMSGAMIVGILLTITPFIFPVVMTLLGLLTGLVQAYIFFVLAAVYIAAATHIQKKPTEQVPA